MCIRDRYQRRVHGIKRKEKMADAKDSFLGRKTVTIGRRSNAKSEYDTVPFSTSNKAVVAYKEAEDIYALDQSRDWNRISTGIIQDTLKRLNERKEIFPSHYHPSCIAGLLLGFLILVLLYVILWSFIVIILFFLLNPIIMAALGWIYWYIFTKAPGLLRTYFDSRRVSALKKFLKKENKDYKKNDYKMDIMCSVEGNFLVVYFEDKNDLDASKIRESGILAEEDKEQHGFILHFLSLIHI
eukprot:TRINITY_DN11207_c0_g1_i1.p1 TRINITY_DN11207_c0_g1~~TRINITY_DN11207_c0_g1_i1.p1  ORF type:complete len:241 (+),score=43.11 TRINITY_DN11207_c0_g1_i1:64-786(+)